MTSEIFLWYLRCYPEVVIGCWLWLWSDTNDWRRFSIAIQSGGGMTDRRTGAMFQMKIFQNVNALGLNKS